jgi:putative acetyltransferase
MHFEICAEPVHSPGALSIINAAQDELDRRYGLEDTDKGHLHDDDMVPPRGAFVVARLNGHLAAGVAVRSIGLSEHHFGEIKRLWVRPDLRGSGVALLIMNAVEDEALNLAMVQLYLETGWLQPEAVAFYLKTGWQRVEKFPDGAWSHPKGIKYTKTL